MGWWCKVLLSTSCYRHACRQLCRSMTITTDHERLGLWESFCLRDTDRGSLLQALVIRDWALLWVLSIGFELMELTFQHMLPNFNECWWDSWVLDVAVCNLLGISSFSQTRCAAFDSRLLLLQVALHFLSHSRPSTFQGHTHACLETYIRCKIVTCCRQALCACYDSLCALACRYICGDENGALVWVTNLRLVRTEPAEDRDGQGQALAAAILAALLGRF